MFKSRMLDAIKQSRYIPPVWLAILIAIGFVYAGGILSFVGMLPIGIVVGLLIGFADPTVDRTAAMEKIGPYTIFFQLAGFFFIALTVFLWVRYREKRPFSSLGFYKQDWFKNLLKGFLIGAVQFSLVVVLILVTGTGSLKFGQVNLKDFIFVLAIIPFWILQGGTEELVTRGWLFPVLYLGLCTSLTLV